MSEKVDEIIAKLQAQQPKLKDADQFADSIMHSLPDLPEEKVPRPQSRLLAVQRTFASIAASFLILITLWQGINAISSSPVQQMSFEQCVAKYESDYSSLSNSDSFDKAVARYESMKKSRPSLIKQLKGTYDEKK